MLETLNQEQDETNVSSNPYDEGFLVNAVARAFQFAKALTLSEFIRMKLVPMFVEADREREGRYRAVEWIVLANAIISMAAAVLFVCVPGIPFYVLLAIMLYAAWRIFELFVTHANVLLFDAYRDRRAKWGHVSEEHLNDIPMIKGSHRTVVLLSFNFWEVAFWYVAAYGFLLQIDAIDIQNGYLGSGETLFYLTQASFRSLVTFSIPEGVVLLPANARSWPFYVVASQSFVGMFMTIVMLARFVSLLPSPVGRTS
jgi:hypothetical protein